MKTKLLFIFWSLWLSAEFLLGPFSHVRIHDAGDGILPQLIASRIQFQRYGYSYFADYMASGVDAAGNYLLPFSNLNSSLFLLLSPSIAYGLLMFAQRFIASYFMFRLARDNLKLNYLPSFICGIIYSLFNFSSFSFTLYHGLGVPALPLILYIMEKIIRNNASIKYFFVLALGLVIGYSNYFILSIPYIMPVIFVWLYFVKKVRFYKSFAFTAIFTVGAFLMQLHTIWGVIVNLPDSHRSTQNLKALSESIGDAKYVFFSQFYKSVIAYLIPITLVLIAFFNHRLSSEKSKILLKICIILFILPVIAKIIQAYLPVSLGVVRTFSWDRFEIISPFFLAITAGYSVNNLIKNKTAFFGTSIMTLLIIVLFGASLKIKVETLLNYAPFRSLYLHPDLKTLAKKVDSEKWRVVSIVGGGHRSSYSLANGLYNVDTYLTLYPKSYHSFWSKVIGNLIKKSRNHREDFLYWGNRIYLYGSPDFYNMESIDFQKYYNLDSLSLANVRYLISLKPVSDQNLILIPSVYRDSISKWKNMKKIEKLKFFVSGKYFGPSLYVYENKKALPRFYIVDSDRIFEKEASDINYSPDKIKLTIEAKEGSSLIAAINYYPYWRLTLNGEKTSIKKYNDTFMKIPLKLGANQILLEYNPPYKI